VCPCSVEQNSPEAREKFTDLISGAGVKGHSNSRFRGVILRIFDTGVVTVLSPVWLPMMCVVGVVIAATYGRPIFFTSKRVGKFGVEFTIWKFRTLGPDKEPLGRLAVFLRRTHLDELPQFWNVMGGSMALVGPRPLQPEDHYSVDGRSGRESLLPGITGPWQVRRSDKYDYSDMVALDAQLIGNTSLGFRFVTLWHTFLLVVRSLRVPGDLARD